MLQRVAGRRADSALRAAARLGVIEPVADEIVFTHPLLASALRQELDPRRRRALHRRLAAVAGDEVERARHLGLAAGRPSEEVADALVMASRREAARGAPGAAGELLELASSLVPRRNRSHGQRDLVEAARLHYRSGDIERARALVEAVLAEDPGPAVAGEAHLALAELQQLMSETIRLSELVMAETRAGPSTRSRAAATASIAHFIAGDAERALELSRTAVALAEDSGVASLFALAASRLAALETWLGNPTPGLLDAAAEAAERSGAYLSYMDSPRFLRGLRHLYRDELDAGRHELTDALSAAQERGDANGASGALLHLVELECRAAAFPAAEARARECLELAEQIGSEQSRGAALYVLALAHAHLGQVEAARNALADGLRIAEEVGDWIFPVQHHGVRGLLALSLGDFEAAANELRDLPRDLLAHGIREPSVFPVWPNTIEALIGVADLDEASALLDIYTGLADEFDCPWAIATAARCAGLLTAARGNLIVAEQRLRVALAVHDRVPSRFEHARTQLALGSVHRRLRRRREARQLLGEAEATLRELGAAHWADRVASEAARIGGRRPRGSAMSVTEEQVARLVATGRTNREVAAALFVTERTVEANLSSVYAKLGVRSRTELTRTLLESGERTTS